MPAGISDYLANKILDHRLGGGDYTRPATVYVALFTVMPSSSGGGTECSAADYARLAVTNNATNFPAASGRQKRNGVAFTWGAGPVNAWGVVVGAALFDAAVSGNMLDFGEFSVSKDVKAGDPAVSIPAAGAVFSHPITA